jgi:mRNA interferase MazF
MNQGDVWLITLDPTIGAEIEKTRPCVVVNDDNFGKLPLRMVVPITDWKDHFSIAPWMVRIEPADGNGLSKESAADCFQLRSISERRFVRRIGKLDESLVERIRAALAVVLTIKS